MVLDSDLFTTAGGREENQDTVSAVANEVRGLYIVADGLGGHRNGKMASECITQSLTEDWKAESDEINKEWMKKHITDANIRLLEKQREENCNMKSTVVALSIDGNKAVWANTGDSRLYYIHKNKIESITEDHSVAYVKYKAGEITRAQLGTDEDQSCLIRALGNEERYEPDVYEHEVEAGDAFLLCCDGMWEYVLDEEILIDYLKAGTAQEWITLLLIRAMDRIQPGNDNLSVVAVKTK